MSFGLCGISMWSGLSFLVIWVHQSFMVDLILALMWTAWKIVGKALYFGPVCKNVVEFSVFNAMKLYSSSFFSQSWQIANNSRRFVLRCSKNSKKRPAGKCMNLKFFLCFIWGNMRKGERQQDETARLARINFVSRWVLRVSHIIKK